MMEDDGHVINLDGREDTRVSDKYRSERGPGSASTAGTARVGSVFQMTGLVGEDDGQQAMSVDRVSVVSGASGKSKTISQLEVKLPWYKDITCKDIRDIMPTLLILFGGLLIMVLVIPYAFASVIRQLEAEQDMKNNLTSTTTQADNTTQ